MKQKLGRRMGARLVRLRSFLLGDRPRSLWVLLTPTLLAIVLDFTLRANMIAGYAIQAKAIYFSATSISAAFWALPLVLASRLFRSNSIPFRAGRIAFFTLWVFPLATFSYGGQALYYRVFHVYIGRDTVRLGIALRGTVGDWFSAWGGPFVFVAIVLAGLVVTAIIYFSMKRVAPSMPKAMPWLLVPTFGIALFCFWNDHIDSRFLQAATPDVCFLHGGVHAIRAAMTGTWRARQGVSLRSPAPLPPLVSTNPKPPNVLLVLTESVRADAICSDPSSCKDEILDDVAADRLSLGKLSSQTPNTFSACMVLWSGLTPNADFKSAHTAPLLWEIARAVGYNTAYVTSQNPDFEDFGAYVRHAGIDVLVTGADLGAMAQEQLGAPDERATAKMMQFLRETAKPPYFGVLQFSNTHAPYRTDPTFLPYTPESKDPLADIKVFHNHYLDAVRLQERTLADFLREMKTLPSWDNTVVIFLSDHGDEFRDHNGLYHNHSLYEEQVRIPGWAVAGKDALDGDARAALAAYRNRRTYAQDIHATVVDLFGIHDAEKSLPLAELVAGRSLLRAPDPSEPTMLLATSTSVWQPDDARFGARCGDRVLMGWGPDRWLCFNTQSDPEEQAPLPIERCGDLVPIVNARFSANMHELGWH